MKPQKERKWIYTFFGVTAAVLSIMILPPMMRKISNLLYKQDVHRRTARNDF